MNDQLRWGDDENSNQGSAPGGAPAAPGDSNNFVAFRKQPPAQDPGASEGDALENNGDARASEETSTDLSDHNKDWPPPGAAVYTTDEAREYLFRVHDILLKERYTQKLVSDHKKLDGRAVPKDGGGMELQITEASLDRYAADNPQKKNGADVVLDPDDKLFDRFKTIAEDKPYRVLIEGAAHQISDTPTPARTPQAEIKPPAQPKTPDVQPLASNEEGDAIETPTPALTSVPIQLYQEALEREGRANELNKDLQDINIKLYETLDSTYDKLSNMQDRFASIAEKVTDNLESPSDIVRSLAEAFKAANGTNTAEILPATPPEHRNTSDASGSSQSQ